MFKVDPAGMDVFSLFRVQKSERSISHKVHRVESFNKLFSVDPND